MMILSLKKYRNVLAWFMSGLILAVIVSLVTLSHTNDEIQAPSFAGSEYSGYQQIDRQPISDFAATHQEPNFYQ
jgi:hypothetical protein